MSSSFANAVTAEQGDSQDQLTDVRSSSVDLLDLLRKAMSDVQCSAESLAAHRGEKDASYVGKVLRMDKPLGASFLMALPADVSARFSKLYAEAHGHIVVPQVSAEEALPMFAAGLVGMLTASLLPARSSGQLKVGVTAKAAKRSA